MVWSRFSWVVVFFPLLWTLAGCTGAIGGAAEKQQVSVASSGANPLQRTVPGDAREISFPDDMSQWKGWVDVTKADTNCLAALPNLSDAASVSQTTQAINCRLANLGADYVVPTSLYFPPGTYYINDTLNLVTPDYSKNPDGSYTFNPGARGGLHVSGRNPANTKISWVGSCDPIANTYPKSTKYPSMVAIDGVYDLTFERLTLDGQNCAGSGLDMTSFKASTSGFRILELVIENLKEVGIVGDRWDVTANEKDQCLVYTSQGLACTNNYPANQGMVSEVTIERNVFRHVKVGIGIGTWNALDYWIRDNLFDSCGLAVTNAVALAGIDWNSTGAGAFDLYNNIFKDSSIGDVAVGNGGVFSLRGNYSIGSQGPFLTTSQWISSDQLFIQDNTVIASKGVTPFNFQNTQNISFFQNTVLTQDNLPAALIQTGYIKSPSDAPGASSLITGIISDSFSNVVSIANTFSSTQPYVSDNHQTVYPTSSSPAYNLAQVLQCSTGAVSLIDGRTACPGAPGKWWTPIFNLITTDDQIGATLNPVMPVIAPVRPEVARHSIAVVQPTSSTIQEAVNQLAALERQCVPGDSLCSNRWSIVYLPQGLFPITRTIQIPAGAHLQIVGVGSGTQLYWNNESIPSGDDGFIFKFNSPSHVILRDLALQGEPDINNPDGIGGAILAEVEDVPSSRVLIEGLNATGGGLVIDGVGNVPFDTRVLQVNTALISGNGNIDAPGYLGFFGGQPSTVTVGKGANLIVQDAWYEGSDSRYITCTDFANITVQGSMISMGGWHGNIPDTGTTFNLEHCQTQTAILNSHLSRVIKDNLSPGYSLALSPTSTTQTNVLLLNVTGDHSTYQGGLATIPSSALGTASAPSNIAAPSALDQSYFLPDPATQANYLIANSTFVQTFSDQNSNSYSWEFAAKIQGTLQKSFIKGALTQTLDPRKRSARLVPEVTDDAVTDIQIYRVSVKEAPQGVQFVRKGEKALTLVPVLRQF